VNVATRYCIHETPFSSKLFNGKIKQQFFITLSWRG
jgi:hypothetical protein